MASHFLFESIPLTSSGDRLCNPNFASGLRARKHQDLKPIEGESAQQALNLDLNCVDFSLTSSEIRPAHTNEVVKACFDSSRLNYVAFFSPFQSLIVWESKDIMCLQCWKGSCCLSHVCPVFFSISI